MKSLLECEHRPARMLRRLNEFIGAGEQGSQVLPLSHERECIGHILSFLVYSNVLTS